VAMEITKVEFQAYEDVRTSGATNMSMLSVIENLSGLDRDTIIEIQRQYYELCKKYPDVRRDHPLIYSFDKGGK
jgi:RNase adaptor protein for sRNA GlmZ degradation